MASLNNEGMWVLVCFVILCGLIYKYLRKQISEFIDTRVAEVSVNIDNAVKSYDRLVLELQEAECTLKHAKEKATDIINSVVFECENMKSSQLSAFKLQLEKKEKDLEMSIKQVYDLAEVELRYKIIDSAKLLAIEYIKDYKKDQPNQSDAIANMIKDLKVN